MPLGVVTVTNSNTQVLAFPVSSQLLVNPSLHSTWGMTEAKHAENVDGFQHD